MLGTYLIHLEKIFCSLYVPIYTVGTRMEPKNTSWNQKANSIFFSNIGFKTVYTTCVASVESIFRRKIQNPKNGNNTSLEPYII